MAHVVLCLHLLQPQSYPHHFHVIVKVHVQDNERPLAIPKLNDVVKLERRQDILQAVPPYFFQVFRLKLVANVARCLSNWLL